MTTEPRTSDRVRQIVVFVLALLAIAGAMIGSGAFGGTPIQDAAGGALASDATLIAPAGPAFGIWSVIYAGLLAYAIWQLFPSQAAREVQRRIGYLIAASMLLNAAWIGSVQLGFLALSVAVIVALLVVLGVAFALLQKTLRHVLTKGSAAAEAIVLDGTVGLYLGWVTVATAANLMAWLTVIGAVPPAAGSEGWTLALIAVTLVLAVPTALWGRGRLTPALGLSWGLAWIAVARLAGEPASASVGVTAAVAAVVVLAAAIATRVVVARSPLL